MTDLKAVDAFGEQAPLQTPGATLTPADLGALTLVMPFKGQGGAVSSALDAALGVGLPPVGQTAQSDGTHVIWFGRDAWLVTGGEVPDAVAAHASVTDQSDGWCAVTLEGPQAADVLARVTPIDLRAGAFPVGHTARTELQHMQASITRLGAAEFLILGFRSMAGTLWHDLAHATQAAAARATADAG